MQILTDLSEVKAAPSCLTIGFFDGVHRGHRFLIRQVTASARRQGSRSVLVTLYPHPNVVLRGAEPFYLTTREERLLLLSELGLDVVVVQPFTPGLAQTRARDFVDHLIAQTGMTEMWVGPDFALGYRREGDITFLRKLGEQRNFVVNVVNRLKLGGDAISSSRIRQALRQGDVTLAARCLGRPYCLQGAVIIGAQRGRTLGFPTANVSVPIERAIPANGAYAAWVRLHAEPGMSSHSIERSWYQTPTSAQSKARGEERHRAVVNIGTRPTFDDGPRTVEVHLLDYHHDIYGQRLTLDFVRRLRPERRFDDVESLVKQIDQDVIQARRLLHEG